jgi:hypothetical protein
VMLPEVAVIVTCCIPVGVGVGGGVDEVGEAGVDDDEHPSTRPAVVRERMQAPRICSDVLRPNRLRGKARRDPNGSRTATAIPTPLRRNGC